MNFKHGHELKGNPSKTLNAYRGMFYRCYNIKNPRYKTYGARGIRVCPRWSGTDGFLNFLADMGESPKDMSLDRIDVNEGYSSENCRWASPTVQAHNQRPHGKTGIKGVYPHRNKGYKVLIGYKGVREYLGVFNSIEEASIVYEKRAKELYGN